MIKEYRFNARLGKGDSGKKLHDTILELCEFYGVGKTALFKIMIANEKIRIRGEVNGSNSNTQ